MKYYTAVLKKSGRQFVALGLELGVVGSGNTRPKAMQSLHDAISSYLDYAAEAGLPRRGQLQLMSCTNFCFMTNAPGS